MIIMTISSTDMKEFLKTFLVFRPDVAAGFGCELVSTALFIAAVLGLHLLTTPHSQGLFVPKQDSVK